MNNEETINERQRFAENLKSILIARGYPPTAATLERELNLRHYGRPIGLHGVARWLRGEVLPTTKRLQTLAQWLKVDLNELVSEERASKIKYLEDKKTASLQFWHTPASYDDQRLFQLFINLPKEQKKVIREVIIAMYKAYK